MGENIKVSIVVPIYNAEQYLPKCIESILTQTYADLEVVLVDDGSPDDCGIICDEYAAKDPRIVVIHKANGGVTSARRAGAERATGAWISFVDSDDLLPVEAIENLVRNSEGVDIVKGGFHVDKMDKSEIEIVLEEREISGAEAVENILNQKAGFSPLWGVIYRKSLLNSSVFDSSPPAIIHGEDRLNLTCICLKASLMRLISEIVYKYIQHAGSAVDRFVPTYDYVLQYDDCLLKLFKEGDSRQIYDLDLLKFRISALIPLMGSQTMKMSSEYVRRIRSDHGSTPKSLGQRVILFLAGLPYWLRKPLYSIFSRISSVMYQRRKRYE